ESTGSSSSPRAFRRSPTQCSRSRATRPSCAGSRQAREAPSTSSASRPRSTRYESSRWSHSGRYDGSMAVQASTRKLDARAIRADFPIFEQLIHGKPLAYLDSANSSQKPRQVLDAMTEFYETSYANVHRAVHVLG